MTNLTDPSPGLPPKSLSGAFRRFGPYGPVCEVIGGGTSGTPEDLLMRIRVLETGEETDYPLSDILADPQD